MINWHVCEITFRIATVWIWYKWKRDWIYELTKWILHPEACIATEMIGCSIICCNIVYYVCYIDVLVIEQTSIVSTCDLVFINITSFWSYISSWLSFALALTLAISLLLSLYHSLDLSLSCSLSLSLSLSCSRRLFPPLSLSIYIYI